MLTFRCWLINPIPKHSFIMTIPVFRYGNWYKGVIDLFEEIEYFNSNTALIKLKTELPVSQIKRSC